MSGQGSDSQKKMDSSSQSSPSMKVLRKASSTPSEFKSASATKLATRTSSNVSSPKNSTLTRPSQSSTSIETGLALDPFHDTNELFDLHVLEMSKGEATVNDVAQIDLDGFLLAALANPNDRRFMLMLDQDIVFFMEDSS